MSGTKTGRGIVYQTAIVLPQRQGSRSKFSLAMTWRMSAQTLSMLPQSWLPRSIASKTQNDVCTIRDYHKAFAHHSNTFLYGGKVVVSTFAGQACTFGQSSLDFAWQYIKKELEAIAPVTLFPLFTSSRLIGLFRFISSPPYLSIRLVIPSSHVLMGFSMCVLCGNVEKAANLL
jgi:hypothetical protein